MFSAINDSTCSGILKMVMFSVAMVLVGTGIVVSAGEMVEGCGGEKHMSSNAIEQALRQHTDELMSLSGVVGTGQSLCNGIPCIKVFVVNKAPALEQKIHKILEGYPVAIQVTGEFRALPKDKD
jgi:hypothetical protein